MKMPVSKFQFERESKDGIIANDIKVISCDGMLNPDKKIIEHNEIRIRFSYPLSKQVDFKFYSPTGNGFTFMEFWKCVNAGYSFIYGAEEKTSGKTPRICDVSNSSLK